MYIFAIWALPFLILSAAAQATHAPINQNKEPYILQQKGKKRCLPCANFSCPTCNGSITGITGITGMTGNTGPCVSPTGSVIPVTPAVLSCVNVINGGTIGSISAGCEQVNNNLIVGRNVDIKKDAILNQGLFVSGNGCVARDITVGEDELVSGNKAILGTLMVEEGAILSGPFIINNSLIINSDVIVAGSNIVEQALTVQGTGTIAGLITATGGVSVFNGEVINSGGLNIPNTGCTGCTGAIINGNVCINQVETLDGILNVVDNLIVDENAVFNTATVGISGVTGIVTLIANNTVLLNDGLIIAAGDEIISSGGLIINDNLFVNGPTGITTLKGEVTANAGAMIHGGNVVNGGETIALGNLEVPFGNGTIEGSLTINGFITGVGEATLGSLTITDTTNSSSATGPAALIVEGGAGIAKDLWIGDSEYFQNVTSEGGTPTSLDYYETTCFSTPFSWGGITATPTNSVLIPIVRVGNIVNLLIPPMVINNPGTHIDVIASSIPLPSRFRPFSTVRGASSTIISNSVSGALTGQLGEYNVSPAGIITLGLPTPNLGPQLITSTNLVEADANTITYNINDCSRRCKAPTFN